MIESGLTDKKKNVELVIEKAKGMLGKFVNIKLYEVTEINDKGKKTVGLPVESQQYVKFVFVPDITHKRIAFDLQKMGSTKINQLWISPLSGSDQIDLISGTEVKYVNDIENDGTESGFDYAMINAKE